MAILLTPIHLVYQVVSTILFSFHFARICILEYFKTVRGFYMNTSEMKEKEYSGDYLPKVSSLHYLRDVSNEWYLIQLHKNIALIWSKHHKKPIFVIYAADSNLCYFLETSCLNSVWVAWKFHHPWASVPYPKPSKQITSLRCRFSTTIIEKLWQFYNSYHKHRNTN